MKKIFYWLSPFSAIIAFLIIQLINSPKVNFDFRQIAAPVISQFLFLCFFVLTTISFRKIVNNETKKRAWIDYISFTIFTVFVVFVSVIVSSIFLDYHFGCTDFLCGIEIILFPLGTLFWGAILNLIMILTRKKPEEIKFPNN